MTDTQRAVPVCTINLTRSLAVRLTGYGTVLLFLALGIVASLRGSGGHHLDANKALIVTGLLALVASVVTIGLHELVHGVFFWVFGGTPKYGVGVFAWFCPYAYALAPGVPYTLIQMTVIALAPFVLLSAAALVLMWLAPALSTVAAAAFVTNFSGAIGDLWMVRQIWRFRGCRELTIVDSLEGLYIYTPDPDGARVAESVAASVRGGAMSRLMLRWIAATVLMLASVMPLTIAMSLLGARDVTIGPSQFALFAFKGMSDGGFSMEVDPGVAIAAGLLCALLGLLFDARATNSTNGTAAGRSPHPAFF